MKSLLEIPLLALLVGGAVVQPGSGQERIPSLRPGEAVEGEIVAADPVVQTGDLEAKPCGGPARGRRFRFAVDKAGPITLELRSFAFDAYLVLRDGVGNVLARDDDGLLASHARIGWEAESGKEYLVDACALDGGLGAFGLLLRTGKPEEPTLLERGRQELAEWRRIVAERERGPGPRHPAVAAGLRGLARCLYRQGSWAEAEPYARRALEIEESGLSDSAQTAICLSDLAAILAARSRYSEAETLIRRSLELTEKIHGSEHSETAVCINNLAHVLRSLGKHEEAEDLYRRALAILERKPGPDDLETATCLRNLAFLLVEMGRSGEAEPFSRRALKIFERILGADHPETATCIHSLASILKSQSRFDEAARLLRRALAIRENTLGSENPDTATIHCELAWLDQCMGRYESAEAGYKQALEIYRKTLGKGHSYTFRCLVGLAQLLFVMNRCGEAEPLARDALSAAIDVHGPAHPDVAACMAILGNILESLGEYDEAESCLRGALKRLEESLGPSHPQTAAGIGGLGNLLHSLGRYEEAETCFRRALAIAKEQLGEENMDTLGYLALLADLLRYQGKYVEAELLLRRALVLYEKALGPGHSRVAVVCSNLAGVLLSMGRPAEAEKFYTRALDTMGKEVGHRNPYIATCLNNLACCFVSQGRGAEAEPLFRKALAINETLLGMEHPQTATTIHGLADLLHSQARFEEAVLLQGRSLAILEKAFGNDHPDTARISRSLACSEIDLGRIEDAWAHARRGLSGTRIHLARLFSKATEQERYRYVELLKSNCEVLLSISLLNKDGPESGRYLDEAFLALQDWKGQVSRSTSWMRARLLELLPAAHKEKVRELQEVVSSLSKLYTSQEFNPGRDQARLEAMAKVREELEEALYQGLPESWKERPLTVAELAGELPAGSVWVDFFVHRIRQKAVLGDGKVVQWGSWGAPRISAWVLRSGEVHVHHVDLGPADGIAEAARWDLEFLGRERGIRAPSPASRESRSQAKRLRKFIWDPIKAAVGSAGLVFLSPDLFLATIPFEALEEEDGHWLIEKHAFVYLQDGRSLVRLAKRQPVPGSSSLLAIGAVDYDRKGEADGKARAAQVRERGPLRGAWPALPGTLSEVEAVAGLFRNIFGVEGSCRVLQGPEATEERLKDLMAGAGVVHLATHGFFQPEGWRSLQESAREAEAEERGNRGRTWEPAIAGYRPSLLSGIVCAGANEPAAEEREDGLFRAEEVAWMDLKGCDLVVLSACETGLGRAESGEGLLGLRKAFAQAGAGTVISSLRRVEDEAARELFTEFYRRLWAGKEGKLAALRGAQLAMLKRNLERTGEAHPERWGAFVLSGDWR